MMKAALSGVPFAITHRPWHGRLKTVEEIVESVGLEGVVVGEHKYVDDDARVADTFHVGCHARPDRDVAAVKVLTGGELKIHAWHADDEETY